MKNVLIINMHQRYEGIAEGNLTHSIVEAMQCFLRERGHAVKTTEVEAGYEVAEELEKFAWADCIIVQTPVYWMGVPWIGKKYIDEIFSGGGGSVTYENDGRSAEDPQRRYGSGGLMTEKQYMLSFTYNCPKSEFNNRNGFFEGMSVDEAHVALHKTFQFCGARALESFSVHDVYKGDLDLKEVLNELGAVLYKNFS